MVLADFIRRISYAAEPGALEKWLAQARKAMEKTEADAAHAIFKPLGAFGNWQSPVR